MALAVHAHKRSRFHDTAKVVVRLTPAGVGQSWHVHCALIDDEGFGVTSPGPDGHTHPIENGDVLKAAGHTHDFSAQRCDHEHDRRVRHVE